MKLLCISLCFAGFLMWALTGCAKKETFPSEPVISLVSFTPMQDSAQFVFSFTDGEGDIGLGDADTAKPFDYNCFVKYYEKSKGIFEEVTLPAPFNYRIPKVNNGKAKATRGEIKISISPVYYNPFSNKDTCKLELYIVDRELHKSNSIATPELAKPR